MLQSKIIHWILRIIVSTIFIGASIYKIGSPAIFAHEIYNYKLLPVWAINPVAIVLPWFQFWAGLAILFNRSAKGAVLILLAMMVTFQGAVASALFRGLNISCGCFQAGGSAATWLSFLRDFLILISVALYAGLNFRGNRQADAFKRFN